MSELLCLWKNVKSSLDAWREDWCGLVDGYGQVEAVRQRSEEGRTWSDNETFEALLMSVLSNNTDWAKIEGIRTELSDVFSGFDLEWYAGLSEDDISGRIVPWFQERRAGSMVLKHSLVHLIGTADKLYEYSRPDRPAESYFTSLVQRLKNDPKRVALRLGTHGDEYKLPAFGVPLAAEALKNLGFDVAKPDRHLNRAVAAFGLIEVGAWPNRDRRGTPHPNRRLFIDAMAATQEIAAAADVPVALVDNAIWLLCAKSGAWWTNPQLEALAVASDA
ncbi:MAG: hypothetical protein OXH46_05685 [Gemmatimonadetes bacterium]|nr:hypothetical protein [Gemmatimonadota bacterium]